VPQQRNEKPDNDGQVMQETNSVRLPFCVRKSDSSTAVGASYRNYPFDVSAYHGAEQSVF
jgi:hypothetical protein